MRATRHRALPRVADDALPKSLPPIELRHGEALWALTQLGFQGTASESTFSEYVKSLRKLGTPFGHGKTGFPRGRAATYSYYHLMELALALTLRVYHVVPDSVLAEIARYRASLYQYYGRAYLERCTGIGAPITIESPNRKAINVRGAFLDLQLNFSGGKLVSFGPPLLLCPFEALSVFVERDIAARALLPLNLSLLAERLVTAAVHAPRIRRGPRPGSAPRRRSVVVDLEAEK